MEAAWWMTTEIVVQKTSSTVDAKEAHMAVTKPGRVHIADWAQWAPHPRADYAVARYAYAVGSEWHASGLKQQATVHVAQAAPWTGTSGGHQGHTHQGGELYPYSSGAPKL